MLLAASRPDLGARFLIAGIWRSATQRLAQSTALTLAMRLDIFGTVFITVAGATLMIGRSKIRHNALPGAPRTPAATTPLRPPAARHPPAQQAGWTQSCHKPCSGDCQPLAYNIGTHWQDKCSSRRKLLEWNVTQLHLLHSEAESLRDGVGTGAGSNPVQGSGLASKVVPASRQMLADRG